MRGSISCKKIYSIEIFPEKSEIHLFFLRDEVAKDPRKSDGSEEDALHPPLELEVPVFRVAGQVEIDGFVHLTERRKSH